MTLNMLGVRRQALMWVMGIGLMTGFVARVHAAEAEPALVLGIAPHTSARVVFVGYQPLRQFLQKKLQREVRIASAPDFEVFLRRALEGRYDMLITTGHQARLLQTDAGFLPLVTYQADFRMVWVKAAGDQTVQQLEDLNGKRVLSLGSASLTALWSKQSLDEKGVVPARMDAVNASDSLAELVAAGVAVGVLSQAGLNQLDDKVRRQLQVFAQSPSFLGRTYMLHPRHAHESDRVRQALDAFAHSSEGKRYFQHSHLVGYRDVQASELEQMEPYAQALRVLMRGRHETANNVDGQRHVE